MRMPRLEPLLGEFARRRGIEPPLADDRGRFEFVFDPDLVLECFARFGNLHLESPLAMPPEPAAERRRWLERLMNYALHRMKDSHSTPAMSEDGSVVLIARWSLAGTSVDVLEARIEEHLNSVERYREVVGSRAPPAGPATLPHAFVRP